MAKDITIEKPEDLEPGRLIETTGTCRYCRNTRLIRVDAYATEEEKNRIATLECDCADAKEASNIQISIRKVRDKIEERYSRLPDRLRQALHDALEPVAEGYAECITIKADDSITYKVFMKKGAVNLKRIVKKEDTIDG